MNLQRFKHPSSLIPFSLKWGAGLCALVGLSLVVEAGRPSSHLRGLTDTQRVRVSTLLLQDAKSGGAETKISLSAHKLVVSIGEEVALSCPIASGCNKRPTPIGSFEVKIQKDVKLPYFGSYRDANNQVLVTDIDRRKDPMPSGTRFVTEPVQYCLELGDSGLLVHSGSGLPGATTQGNIIIPEAAAAALFSALEDGDTIEIVSE